MGSPTFPACVGIFAPQLTAPALVVTSAYLLLGRSRLRPGSEVAWLSMPVREVREPPYPWPIGVLGAVLGGVIVLQAKRVPGDRPRPSRECLVIQAGVGVRPVEVPTCQGFTTKLAVVRDSAFSFVIPLRPRDGCLVGEEFCCLLGVLHRYHCRHEAVALCPHWEMSVIESLAGAGGCPGESGVSSSMLISDTSTNSKFSSFLHTLFKYH